VRGGSPGVVGRAAMAGTKGPGAVPAEAVLDTVRFRRHREHSVFPLGKLIGECCIEYYFGPQREHVLYIR
jgi:hypothetical protein